MNYPQRINRVIDFIGKHLDEDELNLGQLSGVACFSKYHFHRLFKAYTGLSLQQYIRWLRLKRAAHQLVVDKNSTIIEIAINAGFESHESFTRVFKQTCGLNPSDFRINPCWNVFEKSPYCLPEHGEKTMNVTIKNMNHRRLAVVEHRGDPQNLGESINQLFNWAGVHSVTIKPGEAFGFAYDDPKTTPPSEFRFDLALTVADGLKLDGGVVEKILPSARYAVAVHKGSRNTIGDTVYALYRDWLPGSKEELGDLPCVFCYYNFDHEVAETELLTECWLLLK
jgi:AraC family transcriptional regulator